MTLTVFNTKTHRREPFTTLRDGHVGMYVCGPTVYDLSHIGHARSYVTYDVMKRVFRARGWTVTHVQNFTDLDERITARAKETGVTPREYADRFIQAFFEDMDALRVTHADHYPRVSDHVCEMVEWAEKLVEKNAAYPVDCSVHGCDVYFDVTAAPHFGQLLGQPLKEAAVAETKTEAGHRRHAMDFAVWRNKADLGITWPSPWGDGRPGWHVQCALMSTKYLGPTYDLHGGGLDLVFPHHESETAIAEAMTGEEYCRYYLHNGFVTLGDEKMSKSTGQFVTVRSLLQHHDPEALRLFLLTKPYRAPLAYSEAALAAATERLARWRRGVSTLEARAGGDGARGEPDKALHAAFQEAMEDDFNFQRALATVDEASARAEAGVTPDEAARLLGFLREAGAILGLLWTLTG